MYKKETSLSNNDKEESKPSRLQSLQNLIDGVHMLLKDATAHAEMIAITSASSYIKDWRLNDCDIYITLEPCCMCAGAIMKSRLKNVFFGAYNKSDGCVSSLYNLCNDPRFNHQSGIKGGILGDECSYLFQSFFQDSSIN